MPRENVSLSLLVTWVDFPELIVLGEEYNTKKLVVSCRSCSKQNSIYFPFQFYYKKITLNWPKK